VRDRLAPWVPGFADELEAHSATPLYRGVAQMLREFVRQEAELAG
jgi:TorA maturation chaperone TorD